MYKCFFPLKFFSIISFSFLLIDCLTSCVPAPPRNSLNACKIFHQYPKWYRAVKKTESKWGVAVGTQLAFIYQESGFRAKVRSPRGKILFFLPSWKRVTSSYGYSQAVDGTWKMYKRAVHRSNASRSNFADASDFIGWYIEGMHKRFNVSKGDVYKMYILYHNGCFNVKVDRGLRIRALRVASNARKYSKQLAACKDSLPKEHWWNKVF